MPLSIGPCRYHQEYNLYDSNDCGQLSRALSNDNDLTMSSYQRSKLLPNVRVLRVTPILLLLDRLLKTCLSNRLLR